jgi:putative addiction module killer protein
MIITLEYEVIIYVKENGEKPFVDWIESLSDKTTRYRIKERLDRLILGNLGDHKYISHGVSELRLQFGSGIRIYYGQIKSQIILLLCGGDKSTQKQDIQKAILYWQNYSEINHDEGP